MSKTTNLAAQLPEVPKGPVIARSPALPNTASRISTAIDGHSIGPGIFNFTEARDRTPTTMSSEAPVFRSFDLPTHTKPSTPAVSAVPIWSIYCNECDTVMNNEHFHCSICDDGDFDLCTKCVANGKLCQGDGHWLVKRFVKDGTVQSSTTERLAPRPKSNPVIAAKSIPQITSFKPEPRLSMPGAFGADAATLVEQASSADRTCNSCIDGRFNRSDLYQTIY